MFLFLRDAASKKNEQLCHGVQTEDDIFLPTPSELNNFFPPIFFRATYRNKDELDLSRAFTNIFFVLHIPEGVLLPFCKIDRTKNCLRYLIRFAMTVEYLGCITYIVHDCTSIRD